MGVAASVGGTGKGAGMGLGAAGAASACGATVASRLPWAAMDALLAEAADTGNGEDLALADLTGAESVPLAGDGTVAPEPAHAMEAAHMDNAPTHNAFILYAMVPLCLLRIGNTSFPTWFFV